MDYALPNDIEQMKSLLIAQQALIVRLSGEISGYAREMYSLRALVAKLQRMLFGCSSEKNREKIEKRSRRLKSVLLSFRTDLVKCSRNSPQWTEMQYQKHQTLPPAKHFRQHSPVTCRLSPRQKPNAMSATANLNRWGKVSLNSWISSTPRSG